MQMSTSISVVSKYRNDNYLLRHKPSDLHHCSIVGTPTSRTRSDKTRRRAIAARAGNNNSSMYGDKHLSLCRYVASPCSCITMKRNQTSSNDCETVNAHCYVPLVSRDNHLMRNFIFYQMMLGRILSRNRELLFPSP